MRMPFSRLQPVRSFNNYPILAVQHIARSRHASASLAFYLEDYSPKTLNATVNTSGSADTSASAGTQSSADDRVLDVGDQFIRSVCIRRVLRGRPGRQRQRRLRQL